MASLKEYLKIFTLATGMSLSGNANAQASDVKTDGGENQSRVESVTDEISQEEAAARLQAMVDEYKMHPEQFKEDKELVRAMVVGGSLQPADLTTEDLMEVKKGLTAEEIEMMGERYQGLSRDFTNRYFRNELSDEQIKEGFASDVLAAKDLNSKHIPMIVSDEKTLQRLSENDISNLSYKYTRYYNDNVADIKKEDLIAILNSPMGKHILDSKSGINLSVDRAEDLIRDYDNGKNPRVDFEKLGISREQLLAYSLDKNINKLEPRQAIKYLGQVSYDHNGVRERGKINIGGQPEGKYLDMQKVLDNMERSAELCEKGLSFALDVKYLGVNNSSKEFSRGSAYDQCQATVENVLDYSLQHQNEQDHIKNYIEVVNKANNFVEAELTHQNGPEGRLACQFLDQELVRRGKDIKPNESLFTTTPGFVRQEGWKEADVKRKQLSSASAVIEGAIAYKTDPNRKNPFNKFGNGEYVSALSSLKENEEASIIYVYLYCKDLQKQGKKLGEKEEKYLADLEQKYSNPPYSPTFLQDLNNYAEAVCSGKQKDVASAAHIFSNNSGIKLPESVKYETTKDVTKTSRGWVQPEAGKNLYLNVGSLRSQVAGVLKKQIVEVDQLAEYRAHFIRKGSNGAAYNHAGIKEEKDFYTIGEVFAVADGSRSTALLSNKEGRDTFLEVLEGIKFKDEVLKERGYSACAKMLSDYYTKNKDKEGTLDFVAQALNTKNGQRVIGGIGDAVSVEDFDKLEAMGVLEGKDQEFILAFSKAKDRAKYLAETRTKEERGAETAQINTDALKEAFQTSMEGDALTAAFASVMTGNNDELSAAFASAMAQEQQEGYTQQDVDRHMEEVRGKARHTPPRGSTFDATKLFIKDKTYS